jgi:hypothetical protein
VATQLDTLIRLLEEARTLLRLHGVDFWADWLTKTIDLLRLKDFRGIDHLLKGYEGTMGSFTDVYICPGNGHRVWDDEVLNVNTRLRKIQTEIFELASQAER